MPQVAKRYDEIEVGQILARSEGKVRPSEVGRDRAGTGHAEIKHSLGGTGRSHAKTTSALMRTHGTSSAPTSYHWGEQVRATTLVLNSDAGQKALALLDSSGRAAKQVEINYCFEAAVRAGKLLDFIGGQKEIVPLAAEQGIVVIEKDSAGLFVYTSYPETTRAPGLKPGDGEISIAYWPSTGEYKPYTQSYRVRKGGAMEEL